ncbi:hypothetical protein EV174_006303, partial [Coemansia sp. RSA 2320]
MQGSGDQRPGALAYGQASGNGLAIDTRRSLDASRWDAGEPAFGAQSAGGVRRSSSVMAGRRGSPERQAYGEMHAVTAWGAMAGEQQRAYMASPPHHAGRGARPGYNVTAAGAGDMYTTPPGARRALTTAPHTTGGMSRVGSGESARLRSQAEFDHFNERSIATTLGLDSQLSRFAYDDGSARAHVPGRHARGNSVASPTTRARAIEDARSALTGGPRHVAASDSFAWGSPQAYQGAGSRARTGSLAVQEPGPRVRHPNRAS